MSSSAKFRNKSNRNSKRNEYHTPRSFCEHLCYLLPCFKRRESPASSRSSSKASKHNFFLENHYIIKCPKKKCYHSSHETEECNTSSEEEIIKKSFKAEVEESHDGVRPINQKEVRFLGAAKKNCEKDYLRLLGMEPNEYLNQFSSVFIKNLKSPIPKDPCALPKKFNVYIPPKKKSNRSFGTLGRITDVRNVLQFHRHGRSFSINRSVSNVVKEKCASYQKKNEAFKGKYNQNNCSNDMLFDTITPESAESVERLEPVGVNQHAGTALDRTEPPNWKCSDQRKFRKCDLKKKRKSCKSKTKDFNAFGKSSINENQFKCDVAQSKSHVSKVKKCLPLNEDVEDEECKKQDKSVTDVTCHPNDTFKGNSSGSDDSDERQPLDRNPWPNRDFLQLQAQISNNAFRQAALRRHHKYMKTLIWKLIIKDQKEYIKG